MTCDAHDATLNVCVAALAFASGRNHYENL